MVAGGAYIGQQMLCLLRGRAVVLPAACKAVMAEDYIDAVAVTNRKSIACNFRARCAATIAHGYVHVSVTNSCGTVRPPLSCRSRLQQMEQALTMTYDVPTIQ